MLTESQAKDKIKKSHVRLMKHRETAPYIGAMMLGKVFVIDEWPSATKVAIGNKSQVTAATDGVDIMYGREFISDLEMPNMCGLVLHENLHKFLRQPSRHMDLARENPALLNAAMDYVVNDIIFQIADKSLAVLPTKEGLHDIKFRNWSVREVYYFLKTGKDNQGNSCGKPKKSGTGIDIGGQHYELGTVDGHDFEGLVGKTPEEIQKIQDQISNAIHQGGLLAGRMGLELPKVIKDAAIPVIDWREEMRDFVCTYTRGRDEYTYRRYNKRRMVDDLYLPSTQSEKVDGVILGGDTSGSIGEAEMGKWLEHTQLVCTQAKPTWLKILWWDTKVSSEQQFTEEQYGNIKSQAKPTGGGGTHVGCVANYIKEKAYRADCCVILTDGYTESDIKWDTAIPTLWLVTQNQHFNPPVGKVIFMRD